MGFTDKPLLQINGKTVLQHIIANASLQTDPLLLNINRNQSTYQSYGLPLIKDIAKADAGPLAGVLAAMAWLRENAPDIRYLATFPGDTPWFPNYIVHLLRDGLEHNAAEISWLRTNGQLQPLYALWSMDLMAELHAALAQNHYSPRFFIESRKHALIVLDGLAADMFLNINDERTLASAKTHHIKGK